LRHRGHAWRPVVSGYAGWALLYGFVVGGGLLVLALFSVWAGFWIVALLGVWIAVWLGFSVFWRWADETRRVLLRRRGYY
jgi:hypothetical protein